MPEVVLPAAIARVRVLDPALADALAEDFTRLSRASGAVAWSQAQLVRMLAAPGEQAVLAEVVAAARETTRAPRAWALTWRGDLATGRASFTALAGDGAALDSPPEVSRTILGRVAKEGRPAWSDDASQDARFLAAESVQQASLRSVGCVPLGTSGALWLEDPDNPGRFTPDARMRVAALCVLAGRVLAGRRRAAAPVHAKRQVEPVPGLVGEAPAMDDLYASIRAFAPMPWPALRRDRGDAGGERAVRPRARRVHRR